MVNARNSSTRNEIITLLKTHGSLTVGELAIKLQITEMAVRRHLNTLERDNLIESRMVRQAMGRPTNVYSLSEESAHLFPHQYSTFALDVLQELEEEGGEEIVRHIFKRREEKIEKQYQKEVKGKTLGEKVEQLAFLQNKKGYMVELEKDHETGNILFKGHNCPISQVAKEYTHACDCELSLFERVLQTNIEQISCISKGEERCLYVIKNKEEEEQPFA